MLKALFASAHQRARLIWSIVANRLADEAWVDIANKYPMAQTNFFRQLWAAIKFRARQPVCPVMFVCLFRSRCYGQLQSQPRHRATLAV
ncbi:MAG: hypothetical protein LPH21_09435 [Shewanella sp.]|nr:hypothetical protein [Shewanella sp.]MCF1430476.1 hypothetical protein [Shewanella sp.]MCF1457763.1 hypothetical protein [Shewanella sp.]